MNNSTRVFQGHLNEKNFVGLSCNDDFIICGLSVIPLCIHHKAIIGSELNALHVYHRDVTRALMSYDFGNATVRNDYNKLAILGNEETVKKSNNTDFVSAVCCKKVRRRKRCCNERKHSEFEHSAWCQQQRYRRNTRTFMIRSFPLLRTTFRYDLV